MKTIAYIFASATLACGAVYTGMLNVQVAHAETVPPVIQNIQAYPTVTTTVLIWTTDESTNAQVNYGLSVPYASSTAVLDTSPLLTTHIVTLQGLVACTTYHYSVQSADADTNVSSSTDATFKTFGCAPPAGSSRYSWVANSASSEVVSFSIAMSDDGQRLFRPQITYGYPAQSTNGGATWSDLTSAGLNSRLPAAMSANGRYILTGLVGDTVQVSDDFGATWHSGSGAGTGIWLSVAVSSDGAHMIAANVSGNVMTSDDFGVTWGPENDLGILGWGAVDGSSNHATLVAAPFFGDLYISHDTGVTWAPDVGIPNVGWSDVAVSANGNFIVAVGGGHNIWTSYDGGTTWTEQPGSGSRAWNSVAISQTTNRVVAIDKGGMIYVSDDAGVTWSPEVSLDGGVWLEAAISSDGRTAAVVAPGAKIFIGTDPDEDAPVISSIHTELSGTMATITWNTNELASSQVVYGNTPSYGTTTTISDVTPRVLNHTVVLSNLPTCRTYHFAIVTQDAAQNTTTSTDQTFSIGGCPQSGSGGGSGSRSGGTTSVSSAGTQDNVVAIIKANSALLTNAYKAGFVLPLWIRNILGLNTSAAPSVWQSDLQLGSTGAGVTWLQQFLIDQKIGPAALALGKHGTTNLFGVLTKSALIEWQVAHNIQPAQGYYGPRTRASMQ